MQSQRMTWLTLAGAGLMAIAPLAYGNQAKVVVGGDCSIESEYTVGRYGQAFLFTRIGEEQPRKIAIGGGKLYIDGAQAKLNAADQQRVAEMETRMRALVPQAQEIAREAIDIAFIALIETSKALVPKDEGLQRSLAKARAESGQRVADITLLMDAKVDDKRKADAIEGLIEPVITEYIPKITGSAVSMALGMVFGGEAKAKELEQRLQQMEKSLESKVEARAKALEPKAQAFCEGVTALDTLENTLEYRTTNGESLELFRLHKH